MTQGLDRDPVRAVAWAAVMAGGVGNRLLESGITTSKPLLPVAGKPLISYVLSSIREAGIRKLAVVLREEDQELAEYLTDIDWLDQLELVPARPDGTLSAVLALDAVVDDDFVLSTADVICPSDSVARLLADGRREEWDLIVLTTDIDIDEDPIRVAVEPKSGRIRAIGKGIEGELIFGGIRLIRKGLATRVASSAKLTRDSELLGQIAISGFQVHGVFVAGVTDIDRGTDIGHAEVILRSYDR